MRIGIDIDGVFTDLEQFHIDYGSKYCFENNIEFDIDLSRYDIEGAFRITEEQENDFWEKYLEFYAREERIRPFAKEVIDRLIADGHEIYIITARWLADREVEIGENMRKMVKSWLSENKISYDKIFFTKSDKLQYCIDNKIDLMIDDAPKNIKKISTVLPVICFDATYNRECIGDKIIR